jgi:hypothetical protein
MVAGVLTATINSKGDGWRAGAGYQRRRKLTPTYHERMVWGQGDGSGRRLIPHQRKAFGCRAFEQKLRERCVQMTEKSVIFAQNGPRS